MDRKEAFAIFRQAAPEIYKTTLEKGFWDKKDERNPKEMTMLIISELGEAMEAHRKNRRFPLAIANREMWSTEDARKLLLNNDHDFQPAFETLCKDTLEDEIADTIIRVLDYVYGWNQHGKKLTWESTPFVFDSSKNFAEDLLNITYLVLKAHRNDDYQKNMFPSDDSWGYVLKALIAFCDWWNIDILLHVQWKMRYNETRERLHGKDY